MCQADDTAKGDGSSQSKTAPQSDLAAEVIKLVVFFSKFHPSPDDAAKFMSHVSAITNAASERGAHEALSHYLKRSAELKSPKGDTASPRVDPEA